MSRVTEIIRRARSGESCHEIAKVLKVTKYHVYKKCSQNGVSFRYSPKGEFLCRKYVVKGKNDFVYWANIPMKALRAARLDRECKLKYLIEDGRIVITKAGE
jgi:UDP-N-acetylglucosamine transferase subunit ALG13